MQRRTAWWQNDCNMLDSTMLGDLPPKKTKQLVMDTACLLNFTSFCLQILNDRQRELENHRVALATAKSQYEQAKDGLQRAKETEVPCRCYNVTFSELISFHICLSSHKDIQNVLSKDLEIYHLFLKKETLSLLWEIWEMYKASWVRVLFQTFFEFYQAFMEREEFRLFIQLWSMSSKPEILD